MRIVFLLWAFGTIAAVFGWLLAQTPGKSYAFDIIVWLCSTVLLMTAFFILARKRRAIADPWFLVFLGAELLLCGYALWSFI